MAAAEEGAEAAEAEEHNEAAAVAATVPLPRRRQRKPKSAFTDADRSGYGRGSRLLVGYYALAIILGPDLPKKGFPKLSICRAFPG